MACRTKQQIDRRFLAVAALLDSDKPGERSNALDIGTKMLEAAGLKWRDVVSVSVPQPEPSRRRPPPREPEYEDDDNAGEHCAFCQKALDRPDVLEIITEWEQDFLASIAYRAYLSEKQTIVFRRIKEKIRRELSRRSQNGKRS